LLTQPSGTRLEVYRVQTYLNQLLKTGNFTH